MKISFAPNTNFKSNIRRQQKNIKFNDKNLYIYFQYFDWKTKKYGEERYTLKNKEVYFKYKNKILEQLYI